MHLTSRLTDSLQADRSAPELLGSDHPLARVLHRMRAVREQSAIVTAVISVSVAAQLEGVQQALPVLVAGAVVQAALGWDLALLAWRRRECARELIIEGRADLPLAAVQRERGRLLEPGYREELAAWLDAIREDAEHPRPWPRAARPLFQPAVVAAVTAELAEIAGRLRSDAAGVRGVAMLARLLTNGASPLYGQDVHTLREELHRIRFMLGN